MLTQVSRVTLNHPFSGSPSLGEPCRLRTGGGRIPSGRDDQASRLPCFAKHSKRADDLQLGLLLYSGKRVTA
jgi:hypothetical protein